MNRSKSALSVLVVEDDDALRKRLKQSIEDAGHPVIASESVETLARTPIPVDLAVAVLDMRLPGVNGIAALKIVRQRDPDLPVIFMSGESQPAEIIEGMKLGAIEFLLEPFSLEALLEAIERGAALTRQRLARQHLADQACEQLARLTQREREVLRLLVRGHKTGEAARTLGLAAGTAKIHRMHALEKLQAQAVAEVIAWLRESGLDGIPASA